MARNTAWVIAALLLLPATGRAAGLGEAAALCENDFCDRPQPPQQRTGHPQTAAKPDKPEEKRPERPTKWWVDAKRRAELGITDQQSALVEQVWQKSAPGLREGREKLMKLEDALSSLTDGKDEAAVIAQSEKVESLRAKLNTDRTLMIYRMNLILTPDQRAKVKAMFEHPDQGRRGPSTPR